MRKLFFIPLLLLFGLGLYAQHIEDNLQLLDSLLNKHRNMHFYHSPSLGRADSVWHRTEHFYLYFDIDSLCRQFIRKGGFNAIPDEMDYLYYAVFSEMKPERKAVEIDKMEKNAVKYKSDALMKEVEFLKVLNLPSETAEHFEIRLKSLRVLLDKAKKQKNILMQVRIKESIFYELHHHHRTHESLEEAIKLIEILDSITDEQYANRRTSLFFIGEILYKYGYYQQAIPLFKKSLKHVNCFFERYNLCARNDLGLYYRKIGNLGMSDAYFRSMLRCPDEVKYRGEYDAIAICNLGKNYFIRKDFEKAEKLLRKGLQVMIPFDSCFAAEVMINLGNCYLEKRDMQKTKAMLDSANRYVSVYCENELKIDYYTLMSKYFAVSGDCKKSIEYTDSTVISLIEDQRQFNISHIFNVEKKLFEAEKNVKEKQLNVEKMQKRIYLYLFFGLLILIFLSTGFIYFYFRLHKKASRNLYMRILKENRIRAKLSEARQLLLLQSHIEQENKGQELSIPGTKEQIKKNIILQRLEDLMQTEKLFTEPDISRKKLAAKLSTNETYLANAIREGYNGQTVSEYLNSLRLVFACDLLQNKPELTIKEISNESGFSSYKYFHQLFSEEYGMSPTAYRRYLKC